MELLHLDITNIIRMKVTNFHKGKEFVVTFFTGPCRSIDIFDSY